MKAEQFKAWLRGESVEGHRSQAEIDEGVALQPKRFTVGMGGDDALIHYGEFAGRMISDLSDGELASLAFNSNSEYDAELRDFARFVVEKRRGNHDEED